MKEFADHIEAKFNNVDLADVRETVCECRDEWLAEERINVVKYIKCGEEF